MDWYPYIKLLHVVFVIAWLGGGFGMVALGMRANRAADPADLIAVVLNVIFLANRVFIPASLAALACGIAMVLLENRGQSAI